MDYALRLKGATKKYGGFTLKGIDLDLPRGLIMGLVGENGAGKSTSIKLMLDLIRRDAGDIELLGKDCRALDREDKEKIGVVMDDFCLPEGLNAAEINSVMAAMFKRWEEKKFFELTSRFGLDNKKKIKTYSRGMKTKLSIAVALSHKAELLILDEATTGLDPIVREEILDVFWEFVQNERNSVLISSHIISDLEKICDYIAMIHKGELMFCREKDELLSNYALLKCPKGELLKLDHGDVVGMRENSFGVEALVKRSALPHGAMADRATIEDIMLFHIKGRSL